MIAKTWRVITMLSSLHPRPGSPQSYMMIIRPEITALFISSFLAIRPRTARAEYAQQNLGHARYPLPRGQYIDTNAFTSVVSRKVSRQAKYPAFVTE
jgi:hypothetical protein